MIPKLTLMGLPPELLITILDDVCPFDLAACRLTCKRISALSTSRFGRLFFSTRQHSFSLQSLKALEAITSHPTFGPFVQTITLGETRLRTFQRALFTQEPSPSFMKAYKHRVEEQTTLEASGVAQFLLKKAIIAAKRNGRLLDFGIMLDVEEYPGRPGRRVFKAYGAYHFYRDIVNVDFTSQGLLGRRSLETSTLLLAALQASGSTAVHFTVDAFMIHRGAPLPTSRMGALPEPFNVFSQLRSLKWHGDGRQYEEGPNRAYSLVRGLAHVLHEAENLQKLHVQMEYCPNNVPWLPTLSRDLEQGWSTLYSEPLDIPPLTELKLEDLIVESMEFTCFIRLFNPTLKGLILENCMLYDCGPGGWAPPLGWLMQNAELEHLHVRKLSGWVDEAHPEPRDFHAVWHDLSFPGSDGNFVDRRLSMFKEGCVFEGVQAVKDCLAMLIAEAVRYSL